MKGGGSYMASRPTRPWMGHGYLVLLLGMVYHCSTLPCPALYGLPVQYLALHCPAWSTSAEACPALPCMVHQCKVLVHCSPLEGPEPVLPPGLLSRVIPVSDVP